ncbi:hypothetical protein WME99_25130 [Sorangium sp. So ce136]|uniref:hypothetical protein n=1 Tax=Sorangium sp. So ce136 TaxID=3133284 RepID=UPI003F0271F4
MVTNVELGNMDAASKGRRGLATLASIALGCGIAAVVCGCSSGPTVPVCDEDPVVRPPEDGCGIFVSAGLGDDANPGSRAEPVKTLSKALELADMGSHRVYACAETFNETLGLHSAIIWGGFDCANGWRHSGASAKTVVAPEGPVPEVIWLGGQAIATFANLQIVAPDGNDVDGDERGSIGINALEGVQLKLIASEVITGRGGKPGGSSIAIYLRTGSEIEVIDSNIAAGDGADGEPGASADGMAAADGATGRPGADACTVDAQAGTPGVTTECDDGSSVSGGGGLGLADRSSSGGNGEPVPDPNPTGAGAGGIGQQGSMACSDGQRGLDGAVGVQGQGARRPGVVAWGRTLGKGQDGLSGRPGQGGGGGGGSRGGATACGAGPTGGAFGGSGGSGGCGGKPGKGGFAGGASIGIVTRGSKVTVRGSTIQTGRGGLGGAGGAGLPGGSGATGGDGGRAVPGTLAGCRGGDGGNGGPGGGGGGGLGGHSIGIAYLETGEVTRDDVEATFLLGTAGKGGPGGDPDAAESAGDDGVAAEFLPFVAEDSNDPDSWARE